MIASRLSLLALAASCTLLLSGCLGEEEASLAELKPSADTKSLTVFLSLHKQFCEKEFSDRDALVKALEADSRFRPAPGFMGVYETKVNDISYAVSPEIDGCTTDVMVLNKDTGETLFTYEEMNQALTDNGYRVIGDETTRKDLGSDQQEVTILEKTFMSPAGETTNLDYPSDRPGKYYMTLFAKKFPVNTEMPAASLSLNKQ